jgi:hypothetical protein
MTDIFIKREESMYILIVVEVGPMTFEPTTPETIEGAAQSTRNLQQTFNDRSELACVGA